MTPKIQKSLMQLVDGIMVGLVVVYFGALFYYTLAPVVKACVQ